MFLSYICAIFRDKKANVHSCKVLLIMRVLELLPTVKTDKNFNSYMLYDDKEYLRHVHNTYSHLSESHQQYGKGYIVNTKKLGSRIVSDYTNLLFDVDVTTNRISFKLVEVY